MSSAHFLRRGRRFGLNEVAYVAIDPAVTEWVNRIIFNGGATPSFATQQALSDFYRGLSADGTLGAMAAVNCFVPDSLTASLTPLIALNGKSLWLNNNFVSGDLSVNGLIGNASNKTLDTGIVAALLPFQTASGFSWYAQSVTATGFDVGAYDGTINFIGAAKYTDNNSYGYNSGSSGSNVIATPSHNAGFYSDVRVSAVDHRLFFANSTNAHAQIGATDTLAESGTLTPLNFFVFCVDFNGAVQLPSSDRLSFVAVHSGLTASGSVMLFARVQALRTALGGGFV